MANCFMVDLPVGELDVCRCVSSGQVFRWTQIADDTWFGVDGNEWYAIRQTGTRFRVSTNGDEAAFRRLFRLDWSAAEVLAEILERGPELGPYVDSLAGLRILRPSSPVETFFCFLCTPNNNVTRITSLVRKLAALGPVVGEVSGHAVHRFPTVEVLAGVSEGELRAQGFGYRGATIPSIGRELERRGGLAYLEELKGVGYERCHAELCEFKGIGPKLADCIALFALDHTEAVPVDTHIWQAATRLYFPEWRGTSLTDAKYRAVGEFFRGRFGRLAGWAHQFLFYENLLHWRNR